MQDTVTVRGYEGAVCMQLEFSGVGDGGNAASVPTE